jgi:DNA-binding response OmpR family regulator
MKVIYCNQCNARNMLTSDDLDLFQDFQVRCKICNRLMDKRSRKDVIDTADSKLLFIDDDLGFLQIMSQVMGKDYSVSIASTGKEGFDLAKEMQPDLIILDISLPDIDGYELCQIMKRDEATFHIPIIFATMHGHDIEEQKGFKVGGIDYIKKPISLQALDARIAVHLRVSR